MVNKITVSSSGLRRTTGLVWSYVAIVVGTLGVLAVLSALGSAQATSEAWGHAVLVGVFAVVMPVRMRAARRGRPGALRAVGIIAAVLTVVNAVEALVPHLFPVWMRIEMVGTAMLTGAILLSVVHASRTHRRTGEAAVTPG